MSNPIHATFTHRFDGRWDVIVDEFGSRIIADSYENCEQAAKTLAANWLPCAPADIAVIVNPDSDRG